jgi:Tfp pilus assembly protein PilX
MKTNKRQNGAVLMVSLLILLVLTILAITALSVATLEERMAMAFQYSDATFQGSESGIQRVINAAKQETSIGVTNPSYVDTADQLVATITGGCSGAPNTVALQDETPWALADSGTRITTNVSIQYMGEGPPPPGYSMGAGEGSFITHNLDVTSTSAVAGTGINEEHIQRVYFVRPGGSSSACPLTGS